MQEFAYKHQFKLEIYGFLWKLGGNVAKYLYYAIVYGVVWYDKVDKKGMKVVSRTYEISILAFYYW